MQTCEREAEKTRVLVVDDSRLMRVAVQRVLGQEFDLVESEDGEAGWEKLRHDNRIQVVISDVMMPRLDGYSLICRIRAANESRISGVPVVVITGAEDDITRERAYACGANDFITKPIDSVQLLACVRNLAQSDQDTADVAATAASLGDQSNIDSLTRLENRRCFLEQGREILTAAIRSGSPVSVLRLSVDNFISLRARYGDEYADRVLVWIADLLRTKTRRGDLISRTGNSEFSVMTLSLGRMEAAMLCERLRLAVSSRPFSYDGVEDAVTVSIGLVSSGHDPGDSLDELHGLAYRRLKTAAATGDRSCVGDDPLAPHIEQTVIEQPDMEQALKLLARNEIGQLEPYAVQLALSAIPLIEFCNAKFGLEIGQELKAIKESLARME
ncbi:MAG: GGDEF domain-containing response regulator [Acidiferrobacterales bacterium]